MLLPPFAEEFLCRAAARALFYPTLLYTALACRVLGPRRRRWFDRVDATVVLGALPLRGLTEQLVKQENVRGVITMNEPYETRFLCNSLEEWRDAGVEQLTLSTVDFTGVPSPQQLHAGVAFALKYAALGHSVYVHCKAGRSRSATMVAAYLIQARGPPHLFLSFGMFGQQHLHCTCFSCWWKPDHLEEIPCSHAEQGPNKQMQHKKATVFGI
ncbi:phosphatidylglycerophosphatase and protein-tyrosine phosphatase 1-like isoform X1 [Lampetra planeri]